MAKVFLQYSFVCTTGPISSCIPEGILTQIFTWVMECLFEANLYACTSKQKNPKMSLTYMYVPFLDENKTNLKIVALCIGS